MPRPEFDRREPGADVRGAWETHTTSDPRPTSPETAHTEPLPPQTPSPRGGAELHPLRDAGDVECGERIELVIFRFAGFGRLAHFRRWLLSLPHVVSVRIVNYGGQTASFDLLVDRGTRSSALVLPGTRLLASDGHRVELCVEMP